MATQPVRISKTTLRKVLILCAVQGEKASDWLTRVAEAELAKHQDKLPPAA